MKWTGLKRVKWAAFTFATLVVVALFWLAAEQHYRGCVEAAQHKVSKRWFSEPSKREVSDAVTGCSRLPF